MPSRQAAAKLGASSWVRRTEGYSRRQYGGPDQLGRTASGAMWGVGFAPMTTTPAGSSLLRETRRRPGTALTAALDYPRRRLETPGKTVFTVAGLSLMGLALRVAILLRPISLVDRLFIPDDTYYTLTIARSMAHGHGPTVDGTTLTSGFQPLLGFLMTPVFWLTNGTDAPLGADLALLVVADTAIIVVLAWVAYRLAGKAAAIVAAAVWAISPVGISMSLGGLETSLAMFFEISLVAVWIWANDHRSALRWAAVGGVAGLSVLARTDALLLLGLLVLVQLWRGPRRPLVPAGVVGAVVLGPWWVWCALTFGSPLPTSGPAAHHLLPFKSFSNTTTSLAAGAVSGGPFQPWDWLRLKLIHDTTLGVAVFWVMVAALLALAAGWMFLRPRRAAHDSSETLVSPSTWRVAGTLPAFAALLMIFYSWYGVTFYFTRYLAPVAMVVTMALSALAGRVASVEGRSKYVAAVSMVGVLTVPTVAAARADVRDLTVHALPPVQLNSAHLFDATTGYRDVATQAIRVVPRGAVLGGWQSGAISYFADGHLTVVNLDGVVNPVASALQHRGNFPAEYIRSRDMTWLADYPSIVDVLRQSVHRLDPGATTRVVAALPAVGPSPPIEVAEIVWSPEGGRGR